MVINIKKIQLIEENIGTNYKDFIEESREYHLNIIISDFFFFWKTVLKFTHILSHSRTHLFFKINLGAWSVWLNFVEKRDGAS